MNSDDFYKKLKESLEETTEFPSKYMFKFIVPADDEKVLQIESVFDHLGAVINTKPSSKGKYKSVTILVNMENADEVIEKYKEVGRIEGVISL
ncbi:MAG: DUF493 domain-containing protein [Flavobacteriaceae bacterium]|nr:DUF493 domain-containing protein [Flavobacteriaceae bacterium]MCB0475438.1 DUF493 domain-containing protein [Flavobacteriaceae bacterium]